MATPLPPPDAGGAETSALDQAEQAIIEGKEQVAEQRDKALDQAETQAQRDAVNARFDAVESQLNDLHERVSTATAESVQAAVGPINDQVASLSAKLDQVLAGGAGGAAADDDILSIEEITDDIGDAAGSVGDAVEAAGNEVVDQVDKAPARGHTLFRKMWGG